MTKEEFLAELEEFDESLTNKITPLVNISTLKENPNRLTIYTSVNKFYFYWDVDFSKNTITLAPLTARCLQLDEKKRVFPLNMATLDELLLSFSSFKIVYYPQIETLEETY